MRPLLASLPQKRRNILFLPILAGGLLLFFIILAISTQHFLITALFAPPLAVGLAYGLVGWPHLTRKDGASLVDPKLKPLKPWLFFLLAPLFVVVLYPVLGVTLTSAKFPVTFVAYASMALAFIGGVALAYLLVGFPNLKRIAMRAAERFPAERRPFLFFPTFVFLFLIFYLAFGVLSTRMLGRASQPTSLLNLQVLILLPLTIILAAGVAYLLFGFPKPKHTPIEVIERVPGRRRPLAFLLTFLLLGIPLTFALGALVSQVGLLPDELLLPIGVLLGFSASLGIAALLWGTPAKWRRFSDYKPGLPANTRVPLLVAAILITIVVVTVIFGLAGLDIFWGLLTGLAAGTLLGLKLSGATKRIAARRHEASLVPELPDRVKPLVLFPTWFLTSLLLFAVMTYIMPDPVPANFLIAVTAGLALAVTLVEQTTLQEMMADRKQQKEKRRAFEARRKQALSESPDDARQG